MSHQVFVSGPVQIAKEQPPILQHPPLQESPTPPTPDQVRAVDAVFSEEEKTPVAGLLGLYTGALLLHDIAKDTFTVPDEEPLPKKKKTEEDDESGSES